MPVIGRCRGKIVQSFLRVPRPAHLKNGMKGFSLREAARIPEVNISRPVEIFDLAAQSLIEEFGERAFLPLFQLSEAVFKASNYLENEASLEERLFFELGRLPQKLRN